MRIAFYAPFKPPGHSAPSGDRAMARLLIKALRLAGHDVDVASDLRSFAAQPDAARYAEIYAESGREVARLSKDFAHRRPDLWLTYHPYYKSPDLIGPAIAEAMAIPYATAEASYSARRNHGEWAKTQARVLAAVSQAVVNICFTGRDLAGLQQAAPTGRFVQLPPFIDVTAIPIGVGHEGSRLVAVAMMRPGDKLDSHRMLGQALERLLGHQWTLTLVGDGPARGHVEAAFATIPRERLHWLGELDEAGVHQALAAADIYLWPGCGEAYGLAYLEAQAAGLPVVAQDTAGVPEVVRDGVTGLLTAEGDVAAYAAAIEKLLKDPGLRTSMRAAAIDFARHERSLERASKRLDAILVEAIR